MIVFDIEIRQFCWVTACYHAIGEIIVHHVSIVVLGTSLAFAISASINDTNISWYLATALMHNSDVCISKIAGDADSGVSHTNVFPIQSKSHVVKLVEHLVVPYICLEWIVC